MKKTVSVILAFTLMVTVITVARSLTALAAVGDGNKLSVDINLEVGKDKGGVFTPLTKGQTLKANDEILVRISPKSDFLCGASSYVVMFDKSYFSIVGSNKPAFSVNKSNNYYAQAGANYSGSTIIPDSAWPPSFGSSENYNVYSAVKASIQADSTAPNGGYPEYLPGDWLIQFKLTVKQEINAGANARIRMDPRWFRTPDNAGVDGYFAKCDEGALSSSGSSTIYDFDFDFSGANLQLPLANDQEVTTAATTASTSKTTTPATTATVPGQTTTTTRPSGTTTTKVGGTTAATVPGASTTRDPLKPIPTIPVTAYVTDEAGSNVFVTDEAGSTVYLTTQLSVYVTDEAGSKVYVTDESGSTIYMTSLVYETVDDTQTVTDEDGNPVVQQNGLSTKMIVIIVLAAAAVLGGAAFAVTYYRKKK